MPNLQLDSGSRAFARVRNDRDYLRNRSARYGAGSQNGDAPVIISAIMRPVAGPSVSPQWAWPMASHNPLKPGARPITGRESGSTTYVTANYKQPNFLMIMVDQMGVPRWLPGPTLTNINNLIVNHACAFPNFFAAATACTPSRATLLTGLYSQQTCIFNTLEN